MMKNYKLFISIFLSFTFIVLCNNDVFSQTVTCPPNIDFEDGNLNHWHGFTGTCCPIVTNTPGFVNGRHTITSGTGTDQYGGFPIVPPDGGNHALKIGNNGTGRQAEKVRYFVRVPSDVNNYSFIYRYAVVFQDPGHTPAQQPRFEVRTFDSATNQNISCNTHTYIAASNLPGFVRSNVNSSVFYRSWSTATINLSGYAGRTIVLDFASGDCALSGHFGYGYVDLSCGLFQISSLACEGQVNSTLTAPPGFQSYQWKDSGMANVIGTNQIITVPTPTVKTKYYLILTPFAGFGCPDTLETEIDVTDINANFSITSDSIQCLYGNSFSFLNNSTTSASDISYSWDFGDGNNSTLINPVKSYAIADSLKVRLIAIANDGCRDTVNKFVVVDPMPQVSFDINNEQQCLRGNSFSFTNTSTIAKGTQSYFWDFGNGESSTLNSPDKSYGSEGNYTVKLISASNKGCVDSNSRDINIYPMPVADFTINDTDQCLTGNNFIFTNNSSISSGFFNNYWLFGDGTNSSDAGPSKTYAASDSFSVSLILTSNYNCLDTALKHVIVDPQPQLSFDIDMDEQCLRGNLFVFDNLSFIAKGTQVYLWDFGNSEISTDDSPSFSYSNFGNYNVKLKALSNKLCTDSLEKSLNVYPMPVSSFSINDSNQCLRGNEFVFNNLSQIAEGTVNYQWDYGNGNNSSTSDPVYQFPDYGQYTITLQSISNRQCKDTTYVDIEVFPMPVSAFKIKDSLQCLLGNVFEYTNNSTIPYHEISYKWTLADFSKDTSFNIVRSYQNHGVFSTILEVVSEYGCADTSQQSLEIYPMPVADFSINNSFQCLLGNQFDFTNLSTIPYNSIAFDWDMGNSETSQIANPVYSYPDFGKYTVQLIVNSQYSCADTITRDVEVFPMPLADFSMTDSALCLLGNEFYFNNSTGIAYHSLSHEWDFGNNDSSQSFSPVYAYADFGVYTVRLISTSEYNCADTSYRNLEVYPMPVSDFVLSDTALCLLNNEFTFNNTSTISYNSLSHEWDFGNNNTSNSGSPVYEYPDFGAYVVRLISTSEHSCADTSIRDVEVYPMPVADFKLSATGMCLNINRFVFTNQSTIAYHNMFDDWNFGDAQTSQIQSPAHSYSTEGDYKVTLIVRSEFNCTDSVSKSLTVYPRTMINFIADTVCFGEDNYFKSTSDIITGTIDRQEWSYGDGNKGEGISGFYQYKKPGNYNVRLITTSNFECKDTLEISDAAMVRELPVVDFISDKILDSLIVTGFKFQNLSTGTTFLDYDWTFDIHGFSNEEHPFHQFYDTGIMQVKLKAVDDFGCSDELEKDIYAMPKNKVFIPTAFSPNNDRFNEVFKPEGMPFAVEYEMKIFNRWGELLFTTRQLEVGWDGSFHGAQVQEGLYMYTVMILDMHYERYNLNGAFTLLR